ncbi:MAG: SDR family oxidoreductase [Chitinophagaceae bacterium]|nr:SDR family oxidoreductase [Chitinophagaceae bacterium]
MPTALILGAASDIAIAIAEKFASQGYNIQLAARNVARLQPLQSDLAIKYSSRVSIHEFDALSFESHAAFFDEIEPKPDVTICVFGYLGENEKAVDDWAQASKIIHTNYTGAVSILNIISKYYAERKDGVIVGISSVAGERGRQSNFMYGSAKAGFTAYLSGLRNSLYHKGVHVVTVQPGFVATKMTENLPLPKMLTAKPEEVGEAVFNAVKKRKNVVFVKWFWKYIMMGIRNVPEVMFKKMKL